MGTWDLKLPSSKRSFLEALAREFVSRVEALGFERVEWWTGREWRKSQGRFHILYDNVYDKYHMRLRVKWTDRLAPEEYLAEDDIAPPQSQPQILEQIQQTLEMQRAMLEVALAADAEHSSTTFAEVSARQGASPVLSLQLNTPVAPVAPFFGSWPTAALSPANMERGVER